MINLCPAHPVIPGKMGTSSSHSMEYLQIGAQEELIGNRCKIIMIMGNFPLELLL